MQLKEPEAQMSSATQNNTKTLAKTKSKVVQWGAQIAKRRSTIDGKTMTEKAQAQKRKNNLDYTCKNSKMSARSIPFITEIAAKIGVIIWMFVKENIIGGTLDILHRASWADYIEYIGLTPLMGTQCGTTYLL